MLRAFILLTLALAGCGVSATPSGPKKKDWVFLLPIRIKPQVTDDEKEKLPLIARGTMARAFDEHDIPLVSPIQMQVTEREWGVKLDDQQWGLDLYKKITDRWKAKYIATLTIDTIDSVEGAIEGVPPTPPPPGSQLTTTVKLIGSLYDTVAKKYVFENKEASVKFKVGRPGPSEEQITSERYRAVMEACKGLYKDFLKKQPLKPPARGLGAGGG